MDIIHANKQHAEHYSPELVVKNKKPQETTVAVAMSGGVDSSVVAAIYKKEGYNVIGFTLQLYDNSGMQKGKTCCAIDDVYDAKRVAAKLDIPHYVLNYEELFKANIIDYFVDSYKKGETPVPCIKCNETVKFKYMLEFAKKLGCDAIATGHYIRRTVNDDNIAELRMAVDPTKDQGYFLYSMTQEQLQFTRFPLGEIPKTQTRKIAEKYSLSNANKKDSQGICFVGNQKYADIINKLSPGAMKEGDILDVNGKIIGKHKGTINHTIGQRRGLNISGPEPLYVISINPESNTVTLGPEKYLYRSNFIIKDIHWISGKLPSDITQKNFRVQIRALGNKFAANISHCKDSNNLNIHMHEPQKGITAGQACVIFDQDQILGGGWIVKETDMELEAITSIQDKNSCTQPQPSQ